MDVLDDGFSSTFWYLLPAEEGQSSVLKHYNRQYYRLLSLP